MRKNKAQNYPLELLSKCKLTLEYNIKGVPGMQTDTDMIPKYNKQLRQLKKAIEYLELHERIEKRRRASAKEPALIAQEI